MSKFYDDTDDVKALIYGMPGGGKTTFVSSAIADPRTTPCILLDLEGGTKSIKSLTRVIDWSDIGKPVEGKIDVIRIKDFPDLQRMYDFLFDRKQEDVRSSYKCVIIDSLTEVNYVNLKFCLKSAPASVIRMEPDMPEQRDYMKSNYSMKTLIRGFRDIEGLHVFYTATQQERTEGDSKLVMIKPNLIGKLAEEVMAIVDIVAYQKYSATRKQYEMAFIPEGRFVAKARTERDKPLEKLVDPTVTKLLDALGVS